MFSHNLGTLVTGKPDWLKEMGPRQFQINGITYTESDIGTRQCLMVYNNVDLSDNADNFNELLCMSSGHPVNVTLGKTYKKGHDLLINVEHGTLVYVNGHLFNGTVGLMSTGDGSWSVSFGNSIHKPKHRFIRWLEKIYEKWLDEVYCRAEWLGLIKYEVYHHKSIWHLIFDDLPRGKILGKSYQN